VPTASTTRETLLDAALRLLEERAPDLVESRGDDRPADLGIPEP
jgi:hypothetical protein